MYLDEFISSIKEVVRDVEDNKRSEERGVEIINHLIDEFAVRFTSRFDVRRIALEVLVKCKQDCASRLFTGLLPAWPVS